MRSSATDLDHRVATRTRVNRGGNGCDGREATVDGDRRARCRARVIAVKPSSAVHTCISPSASGRSRTSIREQRSARRRPRSRSTKRSVSTAWDAHAPIQPPPSARSNSQPDGAQRYPRTRRAGASTGRARRTERAVAHHLAQQCRTGRVAELEVAQCDHSRAAASASRSAASSASSANGLSHTTALPGGERGAHMRRVEERRRVHAHEVDVGPGDERAHRGIVRAETTSTTSHPSVAAYTGATTRRPNPVPMTPTFTTRARPPIRRRGTGWRAAGGAGSTPGTPW